jgi:CBS domain-containing protein
MIRDVTSALATCKFIQLSKSLKEYSQRPIEEFMRKNIVTIDEDDNEVLASDLLIRNKIQILPVLRDGKLVGIVTLTDICRVLMEKNENKE